MLDLLYFLRDVVLLLGYLSEKNSFPPPLSPEEEAEYTARKSAGDAEAAQKLVEHNLRLVAHIAKKYKNTDKDMDDLISIGAIGLIKAVNMYDAKKGALSSFAARCIENEIRMTLRSDKKFRREVSLTEPVGYDKEGNEMTYLDILAAEQDDIADTVFMQEQARKLSSLIGGVLTRREHMIISLRYGLLGDKPLTQREVAEMMGISRSYVSRIEKKAIAKLEKKLS